MSRYFQNYWSLTIVAGLVIAIDQATKYLVRQNLPFGGQWAPWDWLLPYARIVHWNNSGAAFGMLPDLKAVFAILAVFVAIAIVYYYRQVPAEDWPLKLAMGMQCGGAIGNLIDRLLHDWHVTDFISVGNFAVFNVADASISVGTVVLVIWVWYKERKEKQAMGASAQAETPPALTPEEPVGE
ncbi:MAG: signal peptidase II [Chloroflexota bacterium]